MEPTDRQLACLRALASRAHDTGMPHLSTSGLSRAQVSDWIDYLRIVLEAHERVEATLKAAREAAADAAAPYLVTPPRGQLPSTYRPPYDLLPPADDHEHLVGSVTREDGVEESVCVLCGVSA